MKSEIIKLDQMVTSSCYNSKLQITQGKIMFSNLDSVHLGNEEKVEDIWYKTVCNLLLTLKSIFNFKNYPFKSRVFCPSYIF